ncbi:hypothetical protein WG66_011961, partial [Moniliophthora roreri]
MPCMGTLLQRSPYETVKTIMTLRLSSAASSGVITIPQRHSCNSKSIFQVLCCIEQVGVWWLWVVSIVATNDVGGGDIDWGWAELEAEPFEVVD